MTNLNIKRQIWAEIKREGVWTDISLAVWRRTDEQSRDLLLNNHRERDQIYKVIWLLTMEHNEYDSRREHNTHTGADAFEHRNFAMDANAAQ